ncbi:hypothetical protein GCM10010129_76130 [Streptomyces fumigatiscleroticus]|nr:hypothetical protein GCM10010129_76130 [Streptomyces fumigatiscleroticus]
MRSRGCAMRSDSVRTRMRNGPTVLRSQSPQPVGQSECAAGPVAGCAVGGRVRSRATDMGLGKAARIRVPPGRLPAPGDFAVLPRPVVGSVVGPTTGPTTGFVS